MTGAPPLSTCPACCAAVQPEAEAAHAEWHAALMRLLEQATRHTENRDRHA